MPRPSTLLNVVLSVVVLAQAWMLYRHDAPDTRVDPDALPTASAHARTPSTAGVAGDDPLALAVMDRLQRIDARLAALEAGARPAAPAAAPLPARIDPRTIADADRRLAALLPDRELDQQDWLRWQTTLAGLSETERFAMSAAFSRALNENRIRLRF
jgi:hypothetical protein